jgi:hypothetical protein
MPPTKTDPKPAEAEDEPQLPCDLCSTLWPEGALENGVCPDCLDSEEEPA